MAANMTTRPRLKQGEQSLGRTRFESGGAGKAVFAVGPAGRVGPAAIRGGAGFYIGFSLRCAGVAVDWGCQVRFCQAWWCQVG